MDTATPAAKPAPDAPDVDVAVWVASQGIEPTDETIPRARQALADGRDGERYWEGKAAEEMLAEMRALEAANGQAEKALAAEGVKLELISLLRVRLEELTEHLLGPVEVGGLPNGPRVAFELRLQQRFARELAGVAGQVARAKLTAPGAVPAGPALIVPGR
jgi:hypothetical protein